MNMRWRAIPDLSVLQNQLSKYIPNYSNKLTEQDIVIALSPQPS